jgi:hypothetical protein
LILPLLSRLAAVDFFGTDDFRERVEVHLGFDDVLRDRVDEREEWEDDRPPCAITCKGSRRAIVARATTVRLNIASPPVQVCDYRAFKETMAS